jgi:hypothetical protein
MASKITIKRSTAALPPAGLSFGELAFVQGTGLTADQLYIGISGGSPVWIGAEISTTGSWTDTNARTSLATQYAIDQRISSQISGSNVITTAEDNTNATKYLVFTSGAGAGVTLGVDVAAGALTYNPSLSQLTMAGDLNVNGGDIFTIQTTATVFNATVTGLSIGSAATGITMGATTGNFGIRNPSLTIGTSGVTGTIFADDASLVLTTKNYTGAMSDPGDSSAKIIINDNIGAGFVNIEGGDLRLGNKTLSASNAAVNLVFEGTTNNANRLTLTAADPASSFTVTLPHATDTLVGKATTDTFTNKTYDTAGTGNVFRIAGVTLSAVTGTGNVNVLATSPTLVTPILGVASATTINKVTLTAPATGSTITVADGKTLTASNTLTFTGTDASSVAFGAGGTVVYTSGLGTNVATFLATPSSANLASALTDETGTGVNVFGTSPTITTSLVAGSSSFDLLNTTATTINFAGGASTALNIGNASSNATFAGNVVVNGNLTVQGDTTTLNTTTLNVEDFNITMGLTLTSAAQCTGAGIGIGVGTGITFAYNHPTTSWLSSVDLDLATAKVYKIGGTSVLSSSALGSGVTGSSLTQVGTITSGTWSGSFGAVSGANLTTLTAGNLSGTIPSGVLGNSSVFIGTTSVALNRGTGALSLTGVNIDGSAGSATTAGTATTATNATNVAITTENSDVESYITFVTTNSSGNQAVKVSSQLQYNALTGELSATLIDGGSF